MLLSTESEEPPEQAKRAETAPRCRCSTPRGTHAPHRYPLRIRDEKHIEAGEKVVARGGIGYARVVRYGVR